MAGRVLVVDDIEVNVRLLEAKLLSEYYDVISASNGSAALELARTAAPDIILLDVMMPGMDGLEVCRRLKEDQATKYIPVVMVTALSDASDRLRGLDVGADDFLTKPVNDLALFSRVRSLIRLKRTLDEWMLREEINGRLASLTKDGQNLETDSLRPANILIVEDSRPAATRLSQTLNWLASRVAISSRNAEAFRLAGSEEFDLVIISMALEHDDPLRLVSQLRASETTRSLPILLIIDDGDLSRAAKGLDLGANDYIARPIDRNELTARARIQIRRKRLQDQLRDNLRRGLSMALTDSLTGVYNRRYLTAHLDTMYDRPPTKEAAILMFDIDRFKQINDNYGHGVGDEVLVEMSRRATSNIRGFDLLARYGGEEFIIVMPECDLQEATNAAIRLCRSIAENPFRISSAPYEIPVTISIGVALADDDAPTPTQLIKNVDRALYAAKNAGRNCVMLWEHNSIRSPRPELSAS